MLLLRWFFSLKNISLSAYEETKKQAQKQAVEWSEFGSPYKVYQVAENEMMLYNAKDTIFVLFEQDLNSTEKNSIPDQKIKF